MTTQQAAPAGEPHFVMDESLTADELKALVVAFNAESARLAENMARCNRLRDLAQHRLIGLELADAERE